MSLASWTFRVFTEHLCTPAVYNGSLPRESNNARRHRFEGRKVRRVNGRRSEKREDERRVMRSANTEAMCGMGECHLCIFIGGGGERKETRYI